MAAAVTEAHRLRSQAEMAAAAVMEAHIPRSRAEMEMETAMEAATKAQRRKCREAKGTFEA